MGRKEMSRISFAVLIALGLMLTSYFGLAAWHVSGGDQTEITGQAFCRGAGELPAQQSAIFVEVATSRSIVGRGIRYSRCDAERILIRWPPRDLATMNLFDRKLFLPVDVVITLAINIVLVVLGYYLVMAWGLLGG